MHSVPSKTCFLVTKVWWEEVALLVGRAWRTSNATLSRRRWGCYLSVAESLTNLDQSADSAFLNRSSSWLGGTHSRVGLCRRNKIKSSNFHLLRLSVLQSFLFPTCKSFQSFFTFSPFFSKMELGTDSNLDTEFGKSYKNWKIWKFRQKVSWIPTRH